MIVGVGGDWEFARTRTQTLFKTRTLLGEGSGGESQRVMERGRVLNCSAPQSLIAHYFSCESLPFMLKEMQASAEFVLEANSLLVRLNPDKLDDVRLG
jgi:hypothetical protein